MDNCVATHCTSYSKISNGTRSGSSAYSSKIADRIGKVRGPQAGVIILQHLHDWSQVLGACDIIKIAPPWNYLRMTLTSAQRFLFSTFEFKSLAYISSDTWEDHACCNQLSSSLSVTRAVCYLDSQSFRPCMILWRIYWALIYPVVVWRIKTMKQMGSYEFQHLSLTPRNSTEIH